MPYIGGYEATQFSNAQLSTLFAPNRIVSSPVMFGSLTVGSDHPWRMLLFRPASLPGYDPLAPNTSTSYTHPGALDPTIPDHLLLDLFWMPVVEPYGISEPLATAGKINLNYQIAPFTYITRNTGMQAVLKSVMITGLNPALNAGNPARYVQPFLTNYKQPVDSGTSYNQGLANNNVTRYAIDPIATLNQLQLPLASTDTSVIPEFNRPSAATYPNFFVSASKICDVPLIPAAPAAYPGTVGVHVPGTLGPFTASNLKSFWSQNCLTGDNELERPYTYIYPRVTTQSNVFTVHVRAQSLQVPGDLSTGAWTEGTDLVTGEYRGSFVIEKYLDPDNANITDSSGNATLASDDSGLTKGQSVRGAQWRILNIKRFGQ